MPDLTNDPPKVAKVFQQVIKAFHVNPKRLHVTGFSQGGFTTFYFLEHHNDILASAAPVAGALRPAAWATDAWRPRVPILVMNGISDTASTMASSTALIDQIVQGLALTGGGEIEGDGHYSWKQWTGATAWTSNTSNTTTAAKPCSVDIASLVASTSKAVRITLG